MPKMATRNFSDFPIEVIYNIFSFLSDEEILSTFGNANRYFKQLVIAYIKVIRLDLVPNKDGKGVQMMGVDRKSIDILFNIPDLTYELVIGSSKYVEDKKTQFTQRKRYENFESNRLRLMICCRRSTDYCYHDIINHHVGMTQQFCDVESLQMEIFQIAWKYPSEQCSHMWNGTCSVQLNSIPKFTSLRKLHFKGDFDIESGVNDNFIRQLTLKLLIDLNLEYCHEITDEGLKYISAECHQLKRFVLIGNKNVSDVGLTHIARGCKPLEKLKISMCNNITDSGIEQVAIGCKKLKIIYLRDVHVTDEGLKHVLNEFDQIEKLTLDGYSNITDIAIPHVITICKNLQEIKLPKYTNVKNESFDLLTHITRI